MSSKPFTYQDFERECDIQLHCHTLDGQTLGAKIYIPQALHQLYPYNSSAYSFLQQLRAEIFALGTIEFPGLPLNKTNYTLAQGAPKEHSYSANPFMTGTCQQPHQDTPPYPTAFWLAAARRYFATWILSITAVETFFELMRNRPELSLEEIHEILLPQSLANQSGFLVNQDPGLILIDNSQHRSLYHTRTCNFTAIAARPDYRSDTPIYAFNEIGLLNYIDTMDERRGQQDRDAANLAEVKAFMENEESKKVLLTADQEGHIH